MGAFCRLVVLGLAVVLGAACSGSQSSRTVTEHVVTPPSNVDHLYFRPVICTIPAESRSAPQSQIAVGPVVGSACRSSTPALIQTPSGEQETAASSVILPYFSGGVRYVVGPADLTAVDVVSAKTELAPGSSVAYEIVLKLTPSGLSKLDGVAASRYPFYRQNPPNPPPQSREAIEVDGLVLIAPPMEAPKFTGSVVISTPGMSSGAVSQVVFMINHAVASARAHPAQT